jgi:hypothetical protein
MPDRGRSPEAGAGFRAGAALNAVRSGGGPCLLPRRAALLGLAGLAGCAGGSPPPPLARAAAPPDGPPVPTVHAVLRGWHTDIGLAVAEMAPALRPLGQDFPGATHLLFGFGERAYWTRPDPSFADMLAALLPGPGVILVTGLRATPAEAFGTADVVSFGVSRAGMEQLSRHLWAALERDAEDRPLLLMPGPYAGSLFYGSGQVYAAGYTCNTWTAEALQAAGVPVSPSGVLFAGQLMARLRRIAAGGSGSPQGEIARPA